MKRRPQLACFLVLFTYLSVSSATVYDLADDWNWNYLNDPSSVWSYNYGALKMGVKTNWNGTGNRAFAPNQYNLGHVPAILLVESSSILSNQNINRGSVGDVLIHGTDGYSSFWYGPSWWANITWTSDEEGMATITGNSWIAQDRNIDMGWNIYVNDILVTGGVLTPSDWSEDFADGSGGVAALTFGLSVGDVVKLELTSESYGSGGTLPLATYVGFDFAIETSAVPVPSTILLVGFGLIAGARVRRSTDLRENGEYCLPVAG